MRLLHAANLLILVLTSSLSSVHAAASKTEEPLKPCTVRSPSGLFYDLNPMAIHPLPDDGTEPKTNERNVSWTARGYDYQYNFTINFCAPVVEKMEAVDGVNRKIWSNISAFYTKGIRTYSLGQLSTEPVFRGRKLVLNYTDGSPCGPDATLRSDGLFSSSKSHMEETALDTVTHRKSAIISLLCDRDTADPSKPKVGVSFVGGSPDECTYFFEARSQHVCGNYVTEPQAVGPGSVFSLIMFIALAVYILGGVAYQRIVMHQRGWRQLPNYAMWAAVGSFLWSIVTLFCSCCSRGMTRSSGYSQVPVTSRFRNQDAENRLIDGYDEEWDE